MIMRCFLTWVALIILLTSCSTTHSNDNNFSSKRLPASEEFECGYAPARAFNGRRLLALNNIIALHKKRLEKIEQNAEIRAQIQALDEISKKTTYPGVDAIWPYEKVTEVLQAETPAVLEILKLDETRNRQVSENIHYLETQFKPNIANPKYWCSEQQNGNTNSLSPTKGNR
jgi:hypothetical protein